MQPASAVWLASLAICPLPAAPNAYTLDAMASNTSRTGATVFSSAPQNTVSVPLAAPTGPPVTGASKAWRPDTSAIS